MWVGHLEHAPVGWWSLWPREAGQAETGWRLVRSASGRGLAREGARALLDHGFSSCGLSEVVADAMAVNHRSRRVMEALGMRHVRTEVCHWEDPLPGSEEGEVHYAITELQWCSARQTGDHDGESRASSSPWRTADAERRA